ncbi:chloride channel protein, CIC family [Algoriella xinjiangensis]|uniref:Chloride channel protein, CIC family n=1 Tax=Algoriella xinjiangensis TaxID=684065 RepID=A0A1I4XXQ2_9FLAO|nr:chloride channel protein, CIC family [Algoriella xinjiangensis]
MYLSCILVAISSALAVIVLKTFAHSVLEFTLHVSSLLKLPYVTSILPIIGILLTVLVVQKFLDGSIEKGTAQIMIAVAKKSGIMPKKQMYAQIITSSLTVGMGGSAGLESPITITGAAFGSNYAQYYRFKYKDRTLLLACGVAAGIATAFNAPIAGVLFAIEVILADMSVTAFIPLLLSSATGALIANLTLNKSMLLSFRYALGFDYHNTIFYILLGILAGFVSVYHARLFRKIEHKIGSFSKNVYWRAIVGSGLLAILIFFFPTLFGEGFDGIKYLANDEAGFILNNSLLESFKTNQWVILGFVTVTMLIKSIATGLTLGSGGNGGNFAPSLFVGSYLGYVVAKFINLLGFKEVPVGNFTVVGMAALLSGLFHAPLTAIFLIAEITGGYGLIIPLMLVSSISFAIAKRYDKYSMDIYTIADKGMVFTSDKDQNLLNKIDLFEIYIKNIKTLNLDNSIADIKEIFSTTTQYFIPVLNEDQTINGIIDLDYVRPFIFKDAASDKSYAECITQAPTLSVFANATKVIKLMEEKKTDYVLLTKENKFMGYVTESLLLEHYRDNLKKLRIE